MKIISPARYWLILILLSAAPALARAVDADELLPPEQAFRVTAVASQNDRLEVAWDIADGYYLYRSKFRFSTDAKQVELGPPEFPSGEIHHDEFFGDVEAYRHRVVITVPVHYTGAAPHSIELTANSQGCADAGVCYPPQIRKIAVALPPDAGPQSSPVAQAQEGAASAAPKPPVASGGPLSAIANLGKSLGLTAGDDEILEPDRAFPFSAEALDGRTLLVGWNITKGYYLYRDKFSFKLKDAAGVELGDVQMPHGDVKEDEFLGKTEVFHDPVEVRVPLVREAGGPTTVTLEVGYQGCAEGKICYPPLSKSVDLVLPAVQAATAQPPAAPAGSQVRAAAAGSGGPAGEDVRIAAALASGGTLLTLLSFFGFGLLLAFTPCVFPMIPILSSIIVGQGTALTTRRAFTLSLVYVLAMALTYTVAGVVAGMVGENLQAAFQNPWILVAFSGVFVALALSMFGFYELQLPSALQSRITALSNRQHGGSLVGVAVMGLLSALIVGPCVAPPLAGALIYIGQSGDAVLGGMALFALSLGMGAPLLAIGTSAGKWLPRAGAWMDAVKAVFGVLLLGVAVWMLDRILPSQVTLVLWAVLLIVSAVYMGALESLAAGASGWRRLWKGAGLVMLVQGSLMMVGAATGGDDPFQPLRHIGELAATGTAVAEPQHFKRVADLQQLRQALAERGERPALLDFYADWCVECKRMEKYTFSDPAVREALSGMLLLQADVTHNSDADKAMLKHFGIIGPPAMLFFGADGQERRNARLVGFLDPEEFRNHVQRAVR